MLVNSPHQVLPCIFIVLYVVFMKIYQGMILRYFLGALMDEMILYMSDTLKVRQRANKVVNKGCCEVELHDYFFKSKKHGDRG